MSGRRVLFVGDSWLRQLFLNFIELLRPTSRRPEKRPPYFFGGPSTKQISHCKYGGKGAGIDFDRCGWPGNFSWVIGLDGTDHVKSQKELLFASPNADEIDLIYASKVYVNSKELDYHYASFVSRAHIDIVIFDIGRWSVVPGSCCFEKEYMASIDRIRAGLLAHGGKMIVVWGSARLEGGTENTEMSSHLRDALLRRKDITIIDRFSSLAGISESFPRQSYCGHGFSGPITELHAGFVLSALCYEHLLRHKFNGTLLDKDDQFTIIPKRAAIPSWIRRFAG